MAIAAIVATAVAALTLGLLYATFSQTQIAAHYAARTFQQSKKQTRIAKKSASESQFIGRNQSRAFVHVSKVTITLQKPGVLGALMEGILKRKVNFRPTLTLTFENVGSTPTIDVQYSVRVGLETIPMRLQHHWYPYSTPVSAQNLAPRTDREVPVSSPELWEVVETFQAERQELMTTPFDPKRAELADIVVRGRVQYVDVFDGEYFTEFGFSAAYLIEDGERELQPIAAPFPAYAPIDDCPFYAAIKRRALSEGEES